MVWMSGPTITGFPSASGSEMLCDPFGVKPPPTTHAVGHREVGIHLAQAVAQQQVDAPGRSPTGAKAARRTMRDRRAMCDPRFRDQSGDLVKAFGRTRDIDEEGCRAALRPVGRQAVADRLEEQLHPRPRQRSPGSPPGAPRPQASAARPGLPPTCAAGIGWSKRNSPVTAMFVTPTEAKRSACRSDFTSAPAKPVISSARRPRRVRVAGIALRRILRVAHEERHAMRPAGGDHPGPDLDLHRQAVDGAERR